MTWRSKAKVSCSREIGVDWCTAKEVLCCGTEHAIRIDCKRKKENIILVTIIDNVWAPDMSAFGVSACSTTKLIKFISEMMRSK